MVPPPHPQPHASSPFFRPNASILSTMATDTVTLFCFILGDTSSFPVMIGRDKTVGDLKDAIVTKNPNGFGGIDARSLQLYKKIVLNSRRNTIQQSELGEPLEAVDVVSEHFAGDLPKKSVHIIVWSPGK